MKTIITLLIFFFTNPCLASFHIFLENELSETYKHTKPDYTCDIYVRFDSINMHKISVPYSKLHKNSNPIFSSLMTPEMILIQLIFDTDGRKNIVERILTYEWLDSTWTVATYNVFETYGKHDYQLVDTLKSSHTPTSLHIHVEPIIEAPLAPTQILPDLMDVNDLK